MSRDGLVMAFADFPDRLAAAARSADERPVPDGEWGPAEVVRHLIAVEAEVWQARLARVAAEDDPHWAWTEPGVAPGLDDATIDEILATFAAARAVTATTVRALDEAGWARFGTHATYGRLDIEGLLGLANDHDSSHLDSLTG
jgi:hypothetical protein